MNSEETSHEFDLFENMRNQLARIVAHSGYEEIVAERIALYVIQGVREVPRFLNALASDNTPQDETRDILRLVLENADLLGRARMLLAGQAIPEDNTEALNPHVDG